MLAAIWYYFSENLKGEFETQILYLQIYNASCFEFQNFTTRQILI